jgi:hypothetical protein
MEEQSIDILKASTVEDTEITVYSQELALVKEKRKLDLKAGVHRIEYTNVAPQIDPTSVIVEDPTNEKTSILEQNYEYDLMSSSKFLDKCLGKEVTVTDKQGKTYTGKLLNYDTMVILQKKDRSIVTLTEFSKMEISDSSGIFMKPALIWQISLPASGKRDLFISYITGGMNWNADYIVKINDDYTKGDIRSWISIDNKTGTNFENAKLKLVAGDLNFVSSSHSRNMGYETTAKLALSPAGNFAEETLSEYHLYTLERPATLKNNQVKQLSFLSEDSVPVKKELVFDSWKGDKIRVVIHIENSEVKGLGMPLPKGVVRVYKADSEEQFQFLGEDQIDHTPKDKEISLAVGNAFDVTGERIQTNYEKIANDYEKTSYSIEFNNSKSEAQNITVVEHLSGDWQIIDSSEKYKKTDAFTIEFNIPVPANSKKIISYTVENKLVHQ